MDKLKQKKKQTSIKLLLLNLFQSIICKAKYLKIGNVDVVHCLIFEKGISLC